MTGFLLSHLVWILTVVIALILTPSILSRSRPVGSAFAWFLAIILVPYAGIPLFLAFGDRKMLAGKDNFRFRGESRQVGAALSPLEAALGGDGVKACDVEAVEWLFDGEAAYAALIREINAATATIRISTFILGNDDAGLGILKALTERARAGVQVHLLIDDLLFYRAPDLALTQFTAAGGRFERFMPILHIPFRGHANLRNHRKMALFDGVRSFVGGMNLADEYLGPKPSATRWRDISMLLAGAVTAALDEIWCADWRQATGVELPPAASPPGASRSEELKTIAAKKIYVVPSGPDCPDDSIYNAILQASFSARERLWFSTPYFVPDEALFRALIIAIQRGVQVKIFVPHSSNHQLTDVVGAPFLRDLAKAGAGLFRFSGPMLHAKAMLVDHEAIGLGSANLDRRSLFLNYEVALLFRDAAAVAALEGWFNDTERASERGPPPDGRWRRSTLESVARLFSPLL